MDTKTKTRKLVRSGRAVIMSLPKEFLDKSGLKPGDVVGVTYDSVLVIVTPKLPEEKVPEEKSELAD